MKKFIRITIISCLLFGLHSAVFASGVTGTITVGSRPAEAGITPDGSKLYVANTQGDSVSVIDTATDSVVKVIPLTAGGSPHWIAVAPNRNEIYIAERVSGYVDIISTDTDIVVSRVHTDSGLLNRIAVTPDGSKLYTTSAHVNGTIRMSIIDLGTRNVVGHFDTTDPQDEITFSHDGLRGYLGLVINNGNPLTDLYTDVIDLDTNSISSVILGTQINLVSLDNHTAWGINYGNNTISKVDLFSNTIVANTSVGSRPNHMVVDEIGHRIFVTNDTVNTVTVLDSDTLSGLEVISLTGTLPSGIALNQNKTKLYVVNVNSNTVDVITLDQANTPPILNPIGNQVVAEGSQLQFTISASDPDGDNLVYSASNLPPGAVFNQLTHAFTWIPTFDDSGNYPDVEFTVTDDGTPMELAVELITITVGNVNRAPELINPGPQEILAGEHLSFSVSASDPDDDDVVITTTNMPNGATFSGNTLNWTPTNAQEGIWVISFIVTDNGTPEESSLSEVVISVGHVMTPAEEASNLVNVVIGMDLSKNVENSYLANLKKVERFILDGKIQVALNQLDIFVSKINHDFQQGILLEQEYNNLSELSGTLIGDLQ